MAKRAGNSGDDDDGRAGQDPNKRARIPPTRNERNVPLLAEHVPVVLNELSLADIRGFMRVQEEWWDLANAHALFILTAHPRVHPMVRQYARFVLEPVSVTPPPARGVRVVLRRAAHMPWYSFLVLLDRLNGHVEALRDMDTERAQGDEGLTRVSQLLQFLLGAIQHMPEALRLPTLVYWTPMMQHGARTLTSTMARAWERKLDPRAPMSMWQHRDYGTSLVLLTRLRIHLAETHPQENQVTVLDALFDHPTRDPYHPTFCLLTSIQSSLQVLERERVGELVVDDIQDLPDWKRLFTLMQTSPELCAFLNITEASLVAALMRFLFRQQEIMDETAFAFAKQFLDRIPEADRAGIWAQIQYSDAFTDAFKKQWRMLLQQ